MPEFHLHARWVTYKWKSPIIHILILQYHCKHGHLRAWPHVVADSNAHSTEACWLLWRAEIHPCERTCHRMAVVQKSERPRFFGSSWTYCHEEKSRCAARQIHWRLWIFGHWCTQEDRGLWAWVVAQNLDTFGWWWPICGVCCLSCYAYVIMCVYILLGYESGTPTLEGSNAIHNKKR